MAYNGENLSLLTQTVKGDFKIWLYRSVDPIATVRAANYISDANLRGMNVQDLVLVSDTNVPTAQLCLVISINATTGAADLSDGTVIAQTNT
jgi:hypothetical protein